MRHLVPSLLVISATMLTTVQPAAAQPKYCLQGPAYGIPGNCQYWSYSQCMATASGQRATCNLNPAYAYAQQPRARGHRTYRTYRPY